MQSNKRDFSISRNKMHHAECKSKIVQRCQEGDTYPIGSKNDTHPLQYFDTNAKKP